MPAAARRDVYLVSLPTRAALGTALDSSPPENRELVFVRITNADGVHGWGECSALGNRGYTNEWARGAFGILASGFAFDAATHPMAASAVEMANLDLALRAAGESLAAHLGSTRQTVKAGATVGLGSIHATLSAVSDLVSEGYGRVKLKIAPGALSPAVAAVAERHPQLELQVDANGSLDSSHLAEVASLPVSAIEQPFTPGQVELTNQLRRATDAAVLADEEARMVSDVAALGHFDGIVLKPGPVGGIANAVESVRAASSAGLAVAAGGMLESGLGRHALAGLASLDEFTLTGDISPAHRWLAQDPWADLTMLEGQIIVPAAAGLSPGLDRELLDRFTEAKARVLLR